METKHTPGPWVMFQEANGGNVRNVRIVSDDGFICITEWRESAADTNANAQLIAAAPDLLEALQEVVPMLEHILMIKGDPQPGSIGHKARAAIAKATEASK